ncbi:MAG: hypothetical protein LUC87_04435 [Clostridiales bacterium]|nr:hypothetical protein [Clostridiales bacterium]
MDRTSKRRGGSLCDRITAGALAVIALVGCIYIVRYALLGKTLPLVTMCIVEVLLILVAYIAWRGRAPWLLLADGVGCIVLFSLTNSTTVSLFNFGFGIQAAAALLGAVLGTIFAVRARQGLRKGALVPTVALLLIVASVLAFWQVNVAIDKSTEGAAQTELWAVPSAYDSVDCAQPGTVERFTYQTKAYATDERDVEKSAYVYLPYGYDESQQYNILYLMHGTGDDEAYWLVTYSYNKTMIDNMIANGDIEPLIIVTPTFYVEDDCADDLDQLTYSFREELRNDLMPAIESTYSTYAESCDEDGFTASRDHRAFAGLSRGAVTTYHSAFCGSLDYFSWFGTFSGSRTTAEYFQETLQSEAFADYSIHYLYVTSGNFDFALTGQISDYADLLEVEPRLTAGENTTFDIFPMRYHSIGSWHLALYNYLQKVFVGLGG